MKSQWKWQCLIRWFVFKPTAAAFKMDKKHHWSCLPPEHTVLLKEKCVFGTGEFCKPWSHTKSYLLACIIVIFMTLLSYYCNYVMQCFTTVKMKYFLAIVWVYIYTFFFFYNPYLTTKFAIQERVVIQISCKKPQLKTEKLVNCQNEDSNFWSIVVDGYRCLYSWDSSCQISL